MPRSLNVHVLLEWALYGSSHYTDFIKQASHTCSYSYTFGDSNHVVYSTGITAIEAQEAMKHSHANPRHACKLSSVVQCDGVVQILHHCAVRSYSAVQTID